MHINRNYNNKYESSFKPTEEMKAKWHNMLKKKSKSHSNLIFFIFVVSLLIAKYFFN